MTVFKTFLKILYACRIPILTYTIILIIFGGINMQTSDNPTNFKEEKPDILIINNDSNKGITKNLIEHIENNSNIIDIKNDKEKVADALFYRDINYIIYIPKNFNKEFLKGNNPKIKIKTTKDYQASLANIMLEKYLKVANIYASSFDTESQIIENINNTLKIKTDVELKSKLDSSNLANLAYYYNFASYSILAGCVYVICLILSSFKNKNIAKRTIISSMNYKEHNRKLLLSNTFFALIIWFLYILVSILFVGDIVFSYHGLLFILNSLIFTICAISIAFLIGNIVNDKNAINGIVNVVALGSSFLCGAFVPMQYIPTKVLNLAHLLPTYWYIKSNEDLKVMEVININTLKPVFINMLIILLFSLIFIIITNIISRKKRQIN